MNDTIETRWEQQNEAGRLSFTDGDYARAEQSFLAAIREATQLGADNVRLASSLSNLGQLKYKQKDFAQAEALFHRALAIRERVLGPEHFGLVQNINNLAALHYARGELDQAEPLFQRALGISEQHLGESHPDVAVTLNNLARLYFRKNEYASAGPLLARLLSIKEQALGASHPEVAAILTSLAKVRLHQEDYDGGEAFARRALEIREKLQLPNDLAVATALETLAEINAARGRIDAEIRHRERALEVREGAMGADHPVVVAARAALQARRAAAAPPPAPRPVVAQPPVAPRPVAPPPVVKAPAPPPATKPPVVAPPSFVVSPPPARTTRTSSLPFIEVTEAPLFDRMRPPSVPRNSGANGTVAIPVRKGNGNGSNISGAAQTMESPLAFHPLTEALPAMSPPAMSPPAMSPPAMSPPAMSPHNVAPPVAASASLQVEHSLAPDALAQSPFTNSFARLVAETPSGRNAIVHDSPPPTTHRISDPRPEISLDWPIEPRRPWLKIFVGLLVLGAIAGGGWYFLSRYDASSAPAAAAPVAKAKPIVAAPTDTLAVRHDSAPAGPPASIVKPGVTSAIIPTSKPEATTAKPDAPAAKPEAAAVKPVFVPTGPATPTSQDEGPPSDAKHASHVAAKPSVAEPDQDIAALPASIKVDAITNMIDDSARHRADSVGSDIQQKPPTFKPKTYKPPA
jgi:Tetratricopeptide repeat